MKKLEEIYNLLFSNNTDCISLGLFMLGRNVSLKEFSNYVANIQINQIIKTAKEFKNYTIPHSLFNIGDLVYWNFTILEKDFWKLEYDLWMCWDIFREYMYNTLGEGEDGLSNYSYNNLKFNFKSKFNYKQPKDFNKFILFLGDFKNKEQFIEKLNNPKSLKYYSKFLYGLFLEIKTKSKKNFEI